MKKNNLAKIVFTLMILTFAQYVAQAQNPDSIVWPGDVNNNGIVNHFDALYIGAAYNAAGQPRNSVSIAWEAEDVAQGWQPLIGGLNGGFIDCNGDGFIGEDDLEAVEVNYGLTHDTVFPDSFTTSSTISDTEIAFDTIGNVIQGSSGQTFVIAIDLGDDNLIIDDFYSLAFSISVNTDFINLSTVFFEIDDTWMNSDNSGLLSIQKKNFDDNTFNVALSRRNMETLSGSGRIGYLTFIIEDDVPGFAPDTEVMQFNETRVFNNHLEETHYVTEGNLLIDFTSPITELPRSEFSIYPNPANNGLVTIEGLENYPAAKVSLVDIMGREMNTEFTGNSLGVNHLPSGVYLININTPKGRLTEKIIINN